MMTPERFLIAHEARFPWSLPEGVPAGLGIKPIAAFTGRGTHALEVALATVDRRPRADELRRVWAGRYGKAPSPLLLVVAYKDEDGWKASICGPVGDEPPAEGGLELGEVERIASAALGEPSRHAAIRFLGSIWAELETELPGLRNQGMFAAHELREGLPLRGDWSTTCVDGRALLKYRGRELVERLGFSVDVHAVAASVLSIAGTKRAVAVFLDEGEEFELSSTRFSGSSPVSHALALADREGLPWVVITRGSQIRVYAARADVGVGRKGRSETYVEANLALLPDERAGYIPLLFSAEALKEGGTFDEILEGSRDYSADLGARLRDRVYSDVVPRLAIALATHDGGALDEEALRHLYEQALTVLFRLLFVAYAEDKDLLPYRSNGAYREHALKTVARDLADRRHGGDLVFDEHATDLWGNVGDLWRAVDVGHVEWGVPQYNGGLFSSDPAVSAAGAALAGIRLTNAEFGPALVAMLVDEAEDAVVGPVDFRSLSVREFGTIYEGLLESNLSVAPVDLTLDARGTYVPLGAGDEVEVAEGAVYFHNRSGARKATGSYFTKDFAVEHLLDHALEPALDGHLARVEALLDSDEDAKAAGAFFDFRCVDLAMGSGHFLVGAVDRIEARLSAFLALRPIPQVAAELDRLRHAALEALGPLGEGVEIEQSTLLRRQVARRCVYGVDVNEIAVELARLGIWIHTFVPGLPLSFLDHSLVCGDSLAGIGTLDEAIQALDPEHVPGQVSLFRDQIMDVLSRAEAALIRLARISETTKADVDAARSAQREAMAATVPVRDLFDLILAGRLGRAARLHAFDEEAVSANPDLAAARSLREELKALHFPIAFPEVFLGDRPGFACILGNPPWEKLQVERHAFWALRFPGVRGLSARQMEAELQRLESERPDLVEELAGEVEAVIARRDLLMKGPFPGLGTSHPDLYKAFAWRYMHLCRDGGTIGVVLPRVAVGAAGMTDWRSAVLEKGRFLDVTTLRNRHGWVFEDVHQQFTIALCALEMGSQSDVVPISGPHASLRDFEGREKSVLLPTEVLKRLPALLLPQLESQAAADVFSKIRASPELASTDQSWWGRSVQGDLNSTTGKTLFSLDAQAHDWLVYKGASFTLWNPDTGDIYGSIDSSTAISHLEAKRQALRGRSGSVFRDLGGAWFDDPLRLPCRAARVAYRRISRATDTRTLLASLVPPNTVLVDTAPYVVFGGEADETDEAFLLGCLCSMPLDWFARRIVEAHVDGFLMNAMPVPRPPRDDRVRLRVVELAGRLAAVDSRYGEWAASVGVPAGGVNDADEKSELLAELDAAVALLYGLNEQGLELVFRTFHEGLDYAPRLRAALDHLGRLA